ncbi:replication-relaxation family protein [Kitasatospora sp. NPDC056531]|uniref:replication-relaxation family protein n=1 Tax=Kitasatospora sp. NPDC056531 TaxID=3345856 RepID=UPI00367AD5F5
MIRQALRDLALHGLVASDGNTKDRHKTGRLEGAAGQVLGMVRSEMGGTARGAGRSGAQHAMAVNETIAAFVLGGTAPGAAGGVGSVCSWSTETEFLLPGGKRKVRSDGVWQAAEIGVPVLTVEVDRSTMAPGRVAAKFTAYRELFRVKVRDNDPARSGEESADRTVHWWRRAYPGRTRHHGPGRNPHRRRRARSGRADRSAGGGLRGAAPCRVHRPVPTAPPATPWTHCCAPTPSASAHPGCRP